MNSLIEYWSLANYLIIQGFGLMLAGAAAVILLYIILRKHYSLRNTLLLGTFFIGVMLFFWFPVGVPKDLAYPFGIKTYGPGYGPTLPLKNIFEFFQHLDSFERVADISRDPRDVPPPTGRWTEAEVEINLTSKEVLSE